VRAGCGVATRARSRTGPATGAARSPAAALAGARRAVACPSQPGVVAAVAAVWRRPLVANPQEQTMPDEKKNPQQGGKPDEKRRQEDIG